MGHLASIANWIVANLGWLVPIGFVFAYVVVTGVTSRTLKAFMKNLQELATPGGVITAVIMLIVWVFVYYQIKKVIGV